MKSYYFLTLFIYAIFSLSSCSSSDDNSDNIQDDLGELIKIQDITTNNHTLELYNKSGMFYTGYNSIILRVKDNATETYFENISIDWTPVMDMITMKHSCPYSTFSKLENSNTLYQASVIYQMTNSDSSGWTLNFNYTINGDEYVASDIITVHQASVQNVTSFQGSDDSRYVFALLAPQEPKIGINAITVGVFKMESMMKFPPVEDFKIELDPRMPGMGNHSSPNNINPEYSNLDNLYHGDLSLTMSGYWKLNFKLFNTEDSLIKGEDITDTNESSSLYLEIEF
ncbi:hypothetical protein [Formosa sp. S-31]|uniref:hypothetical protein n=1 Tax=Formosa sp. S-31 TaxID=2790949 RepID=UPI003EBC4EFF